jgi:hypothetical protein
MLEFLRRFNEEQRKLTCDLLNTIAKLFVAGGLVSPFVSQTDIGWLAAGFAVTSGLAFHVTALYIQRNRKKADV